MGSYCVISTEVQFCKMKRVLEMDAGNGFHNNRNLLNTIWGSSVEASLVAQLVKNLPAMQETQVWFLGWEDPLEKEWQATPVFLLGESHGQRSQAGYSLWGCKNQTRLSLLSAHAHILGVYSTIFKYSIGGEMLAFPSAVSYTFVQTAP